MRLIQFHYPYAFLSLYFYPITLKKKKSLSTKWLGSLPKITQQAAVLKLRVNSRAVTQLYVLHRNVQN